MLAFDPLDPFPLLAPDSHSYAEAQAHARAADQWLGLETEKIEAALAGGEPRAAGPESATEGTGFRQEYWIGLPVQAMLTPYTEIRSLLERLELRAGATVVDLGAGYGRMGFVIGRHYPQAWFVGYEAVAERVEEFRRRLAPWGYERVRMSHADLACASFSPEPADFYFLYDYGSRPAIEKTLSDLQRIARGRAITVVGRGRASRDAIERRHPWLSQVIEPRHFAHYSIYRSGL